jgi:hypothetical protein
MWPIKVRLCKWLAGATMWLTIALIGNAVADEPDPPLSAMRVSCTSTDLNAGPMGKQTTYSVLASFVGNDGQAVGNVVFTVSHADGRNPITIACNTPSVFMELRPGHYIATADMADGPTKTLGFTVAKSGQPKSIVFQFPTISAGVPKPIQRNN